MKEFITNLFKMRKGKVVCITVHDGFKGFVKIIKNRYRKWYVEIVDVGMCYCSQEQLMPGDRLWVSSKEIMHDDNRHLRFKTRRKSDIDDYLPF